MVTGIYDIRSEKKHSEPNIRKPTYSIYILHGLLEIIDVEKLNISKTSSHNENIKAFVSLGIKHTMIKIFLIPVLQ